jgi:hypothetical protein
MNREGFVPTAHGGRVTMLGTVTPGLERYCPILAGQLDAMWPGHPPLFYALPAGRTAPYGRVIRTEATAWTAVLLSGVEYLRRQLGCSHVFVLLEDHVPLWPCDARVVDDVLGIALREDLPCVVFAKYGWPSPNGEPQPDVEGRRRGWRTSDVVTVDGHRMALLPRSFAYYNQCQPALWNADYYASLLTEAVASGVGDPWALERFALAQQPQHYVSEYRWPSRHCGYRRRGRVYLRALYVITMPEGRALRDELVRERFPRLPRPAQRALGAGFELWGDLRWRVAPLRPRGISHAPRRR